LGIVLWRYAPEPIPKLNGTWRHATAARVVRSSPLLLGEPLTGGTLVQGAVDVGFVGQDCFREFGDVGRERGELFCERYFAAKFVGAVLRYRLQPFHKVVRESFIKLQQVILWMQGTDLPRG